MQQIIGLHTLEKAVYGLMVTRGDRCIRRMVTWGINRQRGVSFSLSQPSHPTNLFYSRCIQTSKHRTSKRQLDEQCAVVSWSARALKLIKGRQQNVA